MDATIQKLHQQAEYAYSKGDYKLAESLIVKIFEEFNSENNQFNPRDQQAGIAAAYLLRGHIALYGFCQPQQATLFYQRVLESEPDATIAALAEQGLERCRSEQIASEADTTPATDGAIPDLLKDPFLSEYSDQTKPERPNQVTAMPWLPSDEKPQPIPTPAPTPSPTPEPTLTPEVNSPVKVVTTTPETRSEQKHPEQTPSDKVDPRPQEPAAKDFLEHSWLRVQLKPESSSLTDSSEPMGLISRIKRAFARSSGR